MDVIRISPNDDLLTCLSLLLSYFHSTLKTRQSLFSVVRKFPKQNFQSKILFQYKTSCTCNYQLNCFKCMEQYAPINKTREKNRMAQKAAEEIQLRLCLTLCYDPDKPLRGERPSWYGALLLQSLCPTHSLLFCWANSTQSAGRMAFFWVSKLSQFDKTSYECQSQYNWWGGTP